MMVKINSIKFDNYFYLNISSEIIFDMETLFWETHNNALFNVFMRDLTGNQSINLKHMILDDDNGKHLKPEKKVKHVKKKDLIIQEQNKKRSEKQVKDDFMKIDYAFKDITPENFYDKFNNLKTEKGKQIFKFRLLSHFVYLQKRKEKDYMSQILILYYSLKNKDDLIKSDENYIKLSKRLDKKLGSCDTSSFLMKECSDLLPPLNFWDRGDYVLDDWQKEVIGYIKDSKSVVVRAPTSSGKTFVAMSTGIIHKKILYVCPAKPVAFQVSANFIKMGYRVHVLVENMGHLSYDKDTNIFIGTPDIIEQYLPKIYTNFDYAVFDEIHNLDSMIEYENIIKLVQCPFLALSATIENITFLRDIFMKIHPTKQINYVEYNKRFINIQRWVYNDKLTVLHPLACLENDISEIENLSFTPNDLMNLYDTIYEVFEESDEEENIEYLSPDEYFGSNRLISLDDTKEYENFMKGELPKLYKSYNDKMLQVQDKFKSVTCETLNDTNKMITFFKDCKNNDMLPMLYFHTDESVAKDIFMNLYKNLHKCENREYPFHYDILKKKSELYKKYLERREIYSDSIKIKTKDAHTEKNDKMNRYDKEQRFKYISDVSEYYNKCCGKCDGLPLKNLIKERNMFMENPDFRDVDIFKKHPEFVFTRGDPMSGNEIRNIRREIKKSIGLTIEYENPYFQLLKRGVGLYISSMPDVYNWILQRLMSEKKLGIVISDKTLCLGIDLPIRSVALSGYNSPNYTTSDYLQMGGRAGRRGHDTRGNIIFHGVTNYLNLMKGELPKIIGSSTEIGSSYSMIRSLNRNINTDNLSWRIDYSDKIIKYIDLNPKIHKFAWNLRYYTNIDDFLNEFIKIEKKIFMIDEDNRETWFYRYIIKNLFDLDIDRYLKVYKSNKIENDINITVENLLKIGEIHRHIVNSLDNTFMITKRESQKIFYKIRTLIYKYRGFE
ncbi:MAG: hypothetical protein CMK44_01145 [Porticoccus sp.]|mgnify:CR=1 FL=1|nr:hypothetical protein [Porticoccus sp.]